MLLDALVDHAIRTVPFYQRWASVQPSPHYVFHQLPVVTKADIGKEPDTFRSTAFDPNTLHWEVTSGTTGVPLKVCHDPASLYADIYDIYRSIISFIPSLANSWCGGETMVVIVNDNINRKPSTTIHPELGSGVMHRVILGKSDGEDEQLVHHLRETNIPLLSGRPRALLRLREADTNIPVCTKTITPRAIMVSGDNLHTDERHRLESWFLCPVHNAYASREMGLLGIECKDQMGIHVFCEGALVEILTEKGELVREGSGEMVATNLTNWAMPFLRYRSGDVLTLVDMTCKCGHSGPLITQLSGRDSVYFFFGKRRFNPSLLNPLIESLPIKQFQVIQELDESLHVRWVSSASVDDYNSIELALIKGFERELGNIRIHSERVPEIGHLGQKVQRFLRRTAGHNESG
jgi:phenylacetate-coenzyme A ligase PaaK-like adenylate-forming protein